MPNQFRKRSTQMDLFLNEKLYQPNLLINLFEVKTIANEFKSTALCADP